jgi:hypothetical protein
MGVTKYGSITQPHKGKITQVPVLTGRPVQCSHPEKRCHIHDAAEHWIEVGMSGLKKGAVG